MDLFNSLDYRIQTTVIMILILIVVALVALFSTKLKLRNAKKCKNCGGIIDKEYFLFCPWCHQDFRGGNEEKNEK